MLARFVAISGHLSEVNLNNFESSLTRRVITWKLAPVLGVDQVGQFSLSNFDASSGNLAASGWKP